MEEIIKNLRNYLKEWKELYDNMPTDPQDHSGWRYFHEEEKSLHGTIHHLYAKADAEVLKGLLTAEEQKALEKVLASVV